MIWLKRAVEIAVVFVLFPIAVVLLAAIAVAVSLKALAAYLGALLAAWLFFAFVLPMLTGAMAPAEVVAGVRSRWRNGRHHEGEPIPDMRPRWDLQSRSGDFE